MRINNYINGKGCPECALEKQRDEFSLSIIDVVARVNAVGGKLINPNDYINNRTANLIFECQRCGCHFKSSLQHFLQHGGRVCETCSHLESNGERKIREYLEANKIDYIQEYWFTDCRDIKPLPFDFYLPDKNICIEFDGEQHYHNKGYFHHSVEKVKSHDNIKNKYCKDNNIGLIRIPYWDLYNVQTILDNTFHTKI